MVSFTAKTLVSLKFAGSVFQNSLPCYSSPCIISQESVQAEGFHSTGFEYTKHFQNLNLAFLGMPKWPVNITSTYWLTFQGWRFIIFHISAVAKIHRKSHGLLMTSKPYLKWLWTAWVRNKILGICLLAQSTYLLTETVYLPTAVLWVRHLSIAMSTHKSYQLFRNRYLKGYPTMRNSVGTQDYTIY